MAQMTVAPYRKPTTFAEIVRDEIKREVAVRDLNQTKVGELLGLSQQAVSDRYKGRIHWALNEIELLEEAMGLSRGALLARCAIRDSNPEPADLCPGRDRNTTRALAVVANLVDGWELAA